MSNIGTLLKQEITRLSRREAKGQTQDLRKSAARLRRDIAGLKKAVIAIERNLRQILRQPGKATSPLNTEATTQNSETRRFVAKGFRSMRQRLGLSAGQMGGLLGTSAQTIYNWERGVTRPRREQMPKIAALRGTGKRDALKRLQSPTAAKPPGKTSAGSARTSKKLARARVTKKTR